jgi:hypothetical protein
MALGLAHAIATHLAAEGHGILYGNAGASIFIHEEPAAPDATLTVFEVAGGSMPQPALSEEHLIQVRVRDPSLETGADRLRAAQETLHGASGDLGGILIAYVRATAPGAPLGRELGARDGGRWRLVQTFTVLTKLNFPFV